MSIEQIAAIRILILAGMTDDAIATAMASAINAGDGNGNNGVGRGRGRKQTADDDDVPPDTTPGRNVTYSALVNADRLERIKLTPQERRVAAYVVRHPNKNSKQIATATGIGVKAVQSPIYQLRHTSPKVLRSSQD